MLDPEVWKSAQPWDGEHLATPASRFWDEAISDSNQGRREAASTTSSFHIAFVGAFRVVAPAAPHPQSHQSHKFLAAQEPGDIPVAATPPSSAPAARGLVQWHLER